MLERALIAGGHVNPVGRGQALPRQRVGALGLDPLADGEDGALAVAIKQRDHLARRGGTPCRVNRDAACGQLAHRSVAEGVGADRAEEVDLGAELGQRRRRHHRAAAGVGGLARGALDLAANREVVHAQELDPFDVTYHRDPRHGRGRYRPRRSRP